MDIRQFFAAKKTANKKKVAAAEESSSTTATAPSKSSSNSSNAKSSKSSTAIAASVKKEESTKKRKVIIESEEEEEISVTDFFANTSNNSKSKTAESKKQDASSSSMKKAKPSPNVEAEDEEEEVETKKESPTKKRKSPRKVKQEEVKVNEDTPKKRIRDDFDSSNAETDDEEAFQPDDDVSDDDEEEFQPSPVKPKTSSSSRVKKEERVSSPIKSITSPIKAMTPPKTKSPAKKARKSPASSAKKAKEIIEILEPTLERDSFDIDSVQVPEFMAGITFVFTGVMEGLGRDDASDLIKMLGGRVTGSVSGKTSYLVIGEVLEDGRPYTEGSKYRKASTELKDKTKLVIGKEKFYGLCHLYHEKAMKEKGIDPTTVQVKKDGIHPATTSSSVPPAAVASNPYQKAAVANPYGQKKVNNPYASKNPYNKPAGASSNPYNKSSNQDAKATASSENGSSTVTTSGGNNDLWVDRYKPTSTREILGNKDKVTKLENWLKTWERTFLNSQAAKKTYSNPRGPWKAALLSGPPGIGKTTTATLVSKEDGREVMEFNASDARSKKTLQNVLGELTETQSLSFVKKDSENPKKNQMRVVIMDEVDGMGAGDRSGMAELIIMIKKSKVPIICICNDRQSQKIKSLLPYCMDLKFSRPMKHTLANRAIAIAKQENLVVERNAAEAIAESCGNDVRQVVNLLQMWAQKKKNDGSGGSQELTYRSLKARESTINKDEMLRVSLFDAAKLMLEGRTGLSEADNKTNVDSFFKRNDAFFVDYSFTGLLVQQNYLKVLNGQHLRMKQQQDPVAEQEMLERVHKAAECMSDFNLIENQIRGGEGNWSLLPTAAMLSVKCGYHAGGENGGFLPGFPEFSAWMGKNSTTGKNFRLLNELNHHMNYKVSANALELRKTYLPILRDRIFGLLKKNDKESLVEAIGLMDEYGLSKEDIAEKLDVFVVGKKPESYEDLDSSLKAAFTREYNAGRHMQQALVHEQGGGPIRKKKAARVKDPGDLDAIDEDDIDDDEDSDVDEEKELKKLQEKFKRKKRGKSAGAKKGEKATTKKGAKGKKK